MTPLSKSEAVARLRLIRSSAVGPITFHDLIRHFESAEAALSALPELARRGGRARKIRVISKSDALKEMESLEKMGGAMIFHGSAHYPKPLAAIDDAPPVLSVLGHRHLLEKTLVAIVGTRRASATGIMTAESLAQDLGEADCGIVSGMALGIDGAAHRASLHQGTIAVLAGGVDVVYPPEHETLYREIIDKGCIVSEMPLGTYPKRTHFPRRNRIVSGLAQVVVIVEAPRRSGAMITARLAGEQGRVVCVVPGTPADPRTEGTNMLLRDGATLVRHADDILEEINPLIRTDLEEAGKSDLTPPAASQKTAPSKISDDMREKIINLLSPAPILVDRLVSLSHASAEEVLVVLLELDVAGRLAREAGQKVALLR